MKFLHISDLHIGKKINGYSLIEDQRYILNEIVDIAERKKADAVFIAGDIYDNARPTSEAVTLFDDFITELNKRDIIIYAVSGNHDSGERIDYGRRIFKKNGLFVSGVYNGRMTREVYKDSYGEVNIYMLPFVTNYDVNQFIKEDKEKISDYNSAVEYIIENENIDYSQRNVIIAHQFVTNRGKMPIISESENIVIGGLDNISSANFEKFDYTALGHIHSMQKMSKCADIWYSGAVLKYSFSKEDDNKKAIFVTLNEKGNIEREEIPLKPLREMVIIEKKFDEMIKDECKNDYIKAIITDKEPIYDVFERLKGVYPNIMVVEYKNREDEFIKAITFEDITKKSDLELFEEFYENVNGYKADEESMEIINKLFKEILEGKNEAFSS